MAAVLSGVGKAESGECSAFHAQQGKRITVGAFYLSHNIVPFMLTFSLLCECTGVYNKLNKCFIGS